MEDRAKRPAGLKTRESVLEASKLLFLRQGYHATGMREIARDAGISLGAVYNHFSSKEEIFQELLAERNLYSAMADALSRARGESVAEMMASGFSEIMAALRGKEDFVLLLFIDVLEFQACHVADLAGDAIPRLLAFFQRIYALGQRRGELRRISPLLLGRAYIQLVFSSFVLEGVVKLLAGDRVNALLAVDNWEQGLIDILLHGVLKEPPGEDGER